MPFGPYKNFNACLLDQKKKGHDEEAAKRICGDLQARLEKEKEMSEVFRLFSNAEVEYGDNFDPDKAFEFITSDKQYDTRYGAFSYSQKELREMANNFNRDIRGIEIAVDLNHNREKKAYAWIKPNSMYVSKSKKLTGEYSLYGQLYRYTPEGMELMKTGAYRYFSLEIIPKWTRFIKNAKKVFKNVISGIALTNSPVIKDMAPTFSEDLLTNSNNMEILKLYLASLLAKDIVTPDEKSTMKDMVKKLSEDEAEEVKEDVEKVEEKPEEAEEESAKEGKKEEVEGEEEKKEEEKELSEKVNTLSEENQILKEKIEKGEIAEQFSELTLGENRKTGFRPDDEEEVVAFIKSLSEDQRESFNKIVDLVKSVDLTEHGLSDKGKKKELSEDTITELADKLLSEGKAKDITEAQKMATAELSK